MRMGWNENKRKKMKLFRRLFDTEDGKEVLKILHQETYGNALMARGVAYAFDAGQRSLLFLIISYASPAVDEFFEKIRGGE
jgi:hypothetical protein